MNWNKEEKPTDSTFTELYLFELKIKSTIRATKSRERFTPDFPRGFPLTRAPLHCSSPHKTEDPGGAVNLSGLLWAYRRLGHGPVSFPATVLIHRTKKKLIRGETPVYSTSALLLLERGDGQSYDSLLLVSKKSQKTDLNDLVEHTASLLHSLTRYISDDDRYLVSAFFGCHWLYSGREETGKCSAGETPSCG